MSASKTTVICTKYAPGATPLHRFEWWAWLEGQEEDGPYGWGATEEEAILRLKEIILELYI